MKKNTILFLGDTQWGEQRETPHSISNALLLNYPTCEFSFFYNNSLLNSIEHINQHNAKDIIGKKAHTIVMSLGWVDIAQNNAFSDILPLLKQLIEHLSHISHTKILIATQAVASYKPGKQQDLARQFNDHLAKYASKSTIIVDYNEAFNHFHEKQSLYRSEPHALHYSSAQLTNLGSYLLAQAFLLKMEKNITFTPSLKELQ